MLREERIHGSFTESGHLGLEAEEESQDPIWQAGRQLFSRVSLASSQLADGHADLTLKTGIELRQCVSESARLSADW